MNRETLLAKIEQHLRCEIIYTDCIREMHEKVGPNPLKWLYNRTVDQENNRYKKCVCVGICCTVYIDFVPSSPDIDLLRAIATTWPEYSGNPSYPVPHSSKTPEQAYHSTYNLYVGEYGDARKRLLVYVFECLDILFGSVKK